MKHLTYFADPMCSWCWGFAPQIERLARHVTGRLPIIVVVGGLRAGTREPMSEHLKTDLRGHWQRVASVTGQPFDMSLFSREGFVYDTEPACRAVVTVRDIAPEATLAYLLAVQQAFYAGGRDVTDPHVLAALAAEQGLTPAHFLERFASPAVRAAVERDFLAGPRIGVTGFPTLIAEAPGEPPHLIAAGYARLEPYVQWIDAWLAGEPSR
ncbi:MAG: DsbA family protein [Hyphomicrobiaceae bacterium]|nr:DsbA family protein [Hyphomicrobiaceae bacterium]